MMNKQNTNQGAGQGCTWWGCTLWGCAWLLLMMAVAVMGTTESLTTHETDDSVPSIFQVFSKMIQDISDAVSQKPHVSTTVTAILNKVKSAFDDAQFATLRAGWFLQCIDMCLHGDVDDHGAFSNLFSVNNNVTVEALFKCNHFCVDAGPNFNNKNHSPDHIIVGR
ncbi:uncharacterized protein LOC124113188 [Haliotis rufescens]|uniref:uncharacterized protein LOC124113188 n=1 Tax=Haliotis rufescens TaxID=6454 RepID=UPI00201EC9FA|nr:uncharacterized protein LOC124113188 [Haliotis rufescens]